MAKQTENRNTLKQKEYECMVCGVSLTEEHFEKCMSKGHYIKVNRLIPEQWVTVAVYNIPVGKEIA